MPKFDVDIRRGAYPPHWTKEEGIYHVCFRLADSIPQSKLREWKTERKELLLKNNLTKDEKDRLAHLLSEKIEKYLDAGVGACWLAQSKIAELVSYELKRKEEDWYQFYAWCIMPNHVHVIVQPLGDHTLSDITKIWKGRIARFANQILGRSGAFWQPESFDHLIRNQVSLEETIDYVWGNPEIAHLKDWFWRWKI